ncbi:MAG: TolC family protein, partial [Myxococcaceae bacterium]
QQRKAVLEANLKRSLDQVSRAQGLFEAGRINRSDLLSSQVNAGNDRITLIQSRARIAAAQSDLAAWIAHPASEDLIADNPPFGGANQQIVLSDAIAQARQRRPLYRSLDAQVRASELSVDIARGDYRPRVGAQIRADRQSTSLDVFATQPSFNNSISGGLSINWDLFNGFATNAAAENARLQQRTAQVNLDQALRELEGQVKTAIVQLEVTQEATEVAAANQQIAVEALKVSEGRFSSGAGSTLEVRDAQLKLTQAELTLLESRIDTEIARANLDRVLGNGAKP